MNMKTIVVLLITLLTLAIQFNFGLKKQLVLGTIIPVIFLILFGAMSYINKTYEYAGIGAGCVSAFVIVWIIGRVKSKKHGQDELNRMRARDIE